MGIKLKHGKTYVTRSGVKRIVHRLSPIGIASSGYSFTSKSITGDGVRETYLANGKYVYLRSSPHPFDLVSEVKKND